MAKRVTEAQKKTYQRTRYELAQTRAIAARAAGVTQEWGRTYEYKLNRGDAPVYGPKPHRVQPNKDADAHRAATQMASGIQQAMRLASPVNFDALDPKARRALSDFEYFRVRYFGRRSMPWAVDAMHRLDDMMRTEEREYVVINVAPGIGKSTLLHDFAVWETTKQRWLRGIWGSATAQLATISTKRLRSTLGAAYTVKAKMKDAAAGYGIDAEATLVADYGRFRPIDGGTWRADMFVVEQFDEENYDEKEPTWGAFGENSEEVGWRANLIIWDDLVTKDTIQANVDRIDRHREWFDDVAEERLEPAGLFALMGQRLGANDTYRYCLDKYVSDEIVFEVHDDEHCLGHTAANDKARVPWSPDGTGGCLLDPHRISWKKCLQTMRDETKWETVYQQGDSSAQDVLVQKLWIDGGMDNRTGEMFNGCWDEYRAAYDIPLGHDGEPNKNLVTYMVVDPSPSKWWGCIWMAYDPDTKMRYVLDVHRAKMQAGEFLDVIGGTYVGLAHEWMLRAKDKGFPIRKMVVEVVSAERFLLQYEHVRQWSSRFGVDIISHSTHQNKADAKFGVQTIGGIFRQGLVRLPGLSRPHIKPLVQELTTYPQGASDDLVMAFWFGEYNLATITRPVMTQQPRRFTPSWLRRDGGWAA